MTLTRSAQQVQVRRAGVLVATLQAGYDPHEQRLFLRGTTADVARGDVVTVRGLTRRVVDPPEVWHGVGIVVQMEEQPPFLPDLATLHRGGTPGHFDATLKQWIPPTRAPIWTGPCSVKAESAIGNEAEVAEQQVTVQPFSVTVPMELVDVQPNDVFVVISARDPRLATRDLVVTRVEGGSEEQGRIVRVVDNQG